MQIGWFYLTLISSYHRLRPITMAKNIINRILFGFLCFLTLGCTPKPGSNKEVALVFLNKVKAGNYVEAKSMLWKIEPDIFNTDFKIEKLHDLLIRYEIPDIGKWETNYDTLYMVKRESFSFPLYKGYDNSNRLKEASVEIDFEFKGEHIGHEIMGFIVSTYYDR